MPKPDHNLWTFKYKKKEGGFVGNKSYPDEPESHYVYDNTVKNHDKVLSGDLIVIAGKSEIIGIARIEEIKIQKNVPKIRFRCPYPDCNSQEIYYRKKVYPKYKCRNKHEFDTPEEERLLVDQFTAWYRPTFIAAPPGLETKQLGPYYINHNLYYSIQRTQVEFLTDKMLSVSKGLLQKETRTSEAIADLLLYMPYISIDEDTRKLAYILKLAREGQAKFRAGLFENYGICCMLSNCMVETAVEASHIRPYRGNKDNHLSNGLLLRKDLHALFDNNLFGIDPSTLSVRLHPFLKHSYYHGMEGQRLVYKAKKYFPSIEALAKRWDLFIEYKDSCKY